MKESAMSDRTDPTRRALLAMAVLLTASPAFSQMSAPPSDLAQAWRDYDQATMRSDIAALAALVTDDYMLVNSDASVQGKPSYLADFRVPGFRIDPYVIEQPFQRIIGDAALTGGLFQLGWTQDGRHQSRRLRVVHVWTRQGGRWRIAYTQLTRVPE
jgi:ketosteroid isomerase-like protein